MNDIPAEILPQKVERTSGLTCPICLHEYERSRLTKHHLVPKCRKGRVTVLICRPCHSQIHAVFSEKQLERKYNTIESLLSAAEMQDWVTWIRRRKPTGRIRVKKSGSRRRNRRRR